MRFLIVDKHHAVNLDYIAVLAVTKERSGFVVEATFSDSTLGDLTGPLDEDVAEATLELLIELIVSEEPEHCSIYLPAIAATAERSVKGPRIFEGDLEAEVELLPYGGEPCGHDEDPED